jgi:hypothetical protein
VVERVCSSAHIIQIPITYENEYSDAYSLEPLMVISGSIDNSMPIYGSLIFRQLNNGV